MNAGDPPRRTTRSRENSTSSGRTGLPGVERQSVANPQGDGSAVVAHGMALGDATGQRAGILRLERHDPVVDVGQDLARSELERLARIEGDDVTDVLRHNEGVERGLRRSKGERYMRHFAAADRR